VPFGILEKNVTLDCGYGKTPRLAGDGKNNKESTEIPGRRGTPPPDG